MRTDRDPSASCHTISSRPLLYFQGGGRTVYPSRDNDLDLTRCYACL